jgi:hypothetical protein
MIGLLFNAVYGDGRSAGSPASMDRLEAPGIFHLRTTLIDS